MTQTNPEPAAFEALRKRLVEQLGERAVVSDAQTLAPHLLDSRGVYHGSAPFMVQPASTVIE